MIYVVIIAAILAFIPRWFWRGLGFFLLLVFVVATIMQPKPNAERWGHFVFDHQSHLQTTVEVDTNGNHDFTVRNDGDLLVQNILMECQSGDETYPIRLSIMLYPHTSQTEMVYDFRGGQGATCKVSDWDSYQAN